ncbi:MAG: hypothetical protein LUD68_07460 [Rikenellaceae bacterium]|nr:hypothetical protein [Rikenellaceae bacterium]
MEEVLHYYTGLLRQQAEPVYRLARKLDEPSRKELLENIETLTRIELEEDSERLDEQHRMRLIFNVYRNYSGSIRYLTELLEIIPAIPPPVEV